jgi:hypothetical protein
MAEEIQIIDDFEWYSYWDSTLPYRYKTGFSGAWVLFVNSLISQTAEQVMLDALLFRQNKSGNCPTDVLGEIGAEYGVIRAANETDADFKTRIDNRWTILPYYGQESALASTIEDVGYGEVIISTYLMGTDYDIPAPYTGQPIPAYPPSSEYPSQFTVMIQVTESIAIEDQGESALMTDAQLNTVRAFIKQMKPVDWICREIVLIAPFNPISDAFYDLPLMEDGVNINAWDVTPITWRDADLGSAFAMERHRGYV